MRKSTLLPTLALSLLTLGGIGFAGPAGAAAVGPGPDPNESGVTETADQPEAPEPAEAPEAAADPEDTGAVDPTDAEAADPPEAEVPDDPEAPEVPDDAEVPDDPAVPDDPDVTETADQPDAADAADPPEDDDMDDDMDDDSGDTTDAEVLAVGQENIGATPRGGASTGAGGMAPTGDGNPVPFVLAGGLGLALLTAGAAARRRLAVETPGSNQG